MSEEELVTQAEMNNLLLHQKTEFRLQEVDKTMERLFTKLSEIKAGQEGQQRRINDCKDSLKQEIEEDFVTKEDFKEFAIKSDEQWKKLHWMLSGALVVILAGSWLLNQYAVVDKIINSQTATIEQAVTKALKEE